MEKREVKYVQLHTSAYVPNAGNLSPTLEWNNKTGIRMFYSADGVLVSYKNVEFIIPLANVVSAVFASEAEIASRGTKPKAA